MTRTTAAAPTLRLFDLDVHAETLEQTARRCIALARAGAADSAARRPALVFSLNPEKSMKAAQDPRVNALLRRATLLIPDGIGVCLAARLLAGARLSRVPGSDLMPMLCAAAESEGLSVYVYGASARSNADAVQAMRQRWPRLRIVGSSDGYQPPGTSSDPGDAGTVAADIRRLAPDIVFVGLGSPRQEEWMASVGAELPVGLMQGVGGTIDVLSGTARRAPLAWQRLGLEWLFRLIEDPRRWRRQLALVSFTGFVLRRRLARMLSLRHA